MTVCGPSASGAAWRPLPRMWRQGRAVGASLWIRALCAVVLCAGGLRPHLLHAQQRSDVIKGRITTDSGVPVTGTVLVTRAPDRTVFQTTADDSGYFRLVITPGSGDYLVYVTGPGRAPFRKRVQLATTDSVVVITARLSAALQQLKEVRVTAARPRPERSSANDGPGVVDQRTEGASGALSPEAEGDIAARAATVPGVTLVSGGTSVFGLDPSQSQTTLNGMRFDGSSLPRDVRTSTRVATSIYDPSRGGFSGADIAVEVAPGSTFSFKRAHLTSSALSVSDGMRRRASPLPQQSNLSLGADGELLDRRLYYNFGVQAKHQDHPAGFERASTETLRALGVPPDSLQRLIGALQSFGTPVSARGGAAIDQVLVLGRIDHTPNADRSWALTGYGQASRQAAALPPATFSSRGIRVRDATAFLAGQFSAYHGAQRSWLSETRSALTLGRRQTEPLVVGPSAEIVLLSDLDDGAERSSAISVGGGGLQTQERRRGNWEITHETRGNLPKVPHTLKLFAQSRIEWLTDLPGSTGSASFGYQSLAAFSANSPARFSRTTGADRVRIAQWSGALALADQWKAGDRLSLLYGARVEANHFLTHVPANREVWALLGARTDYAPNTLHVSPRLGFTWAYDAKRQGLVRQDASALGTRYALTTGVLRGGIGEFRSAIPLEALRGSLVSTGLEGAVRRVSCVGDAIPLSDWQLYTADPSQLPTRCRDQAPEAFVDTAPNIEMLAPHFSPPRSWRGQLAWTVGLHRLTLVATGTYSLNLAQPSISDVNLSAEPRFFLADEGRPVFINAASVVPTTGASVVTDSRAAPRFGTVVARHSDLRSRTAQLTVSVTPDLPLNRYLLTGAYTLSSNRGLYRGFDVGAFGDPREKQWSRGPYDIRHQVVVQAGIQTRVASVSLITRFASGIPFTPLVAGDVNGDGFVNDRAYVFDPAYSADSSVANSMRRLLGTAPRRIRNCLRRRLGRAAEPNGCNGPWTIPMNVRIGLTKSLPGTADRVHAALNLADPVGAFQQLALGRRTGGGWGSAVIPDPYLLRPRGFDSVAKQFRYEVNPHFGRPFAAAGIAAKPPVVSLDISVDLGAPIPVQQLNRSLRPGEGGHPPTMGAVKARYANLVPNIYGMILEQSDSLLLTADQMTQLRAANQSYSIRLDSVWTSLAEYLIAIPRTWDAAAAVRHADAATEAAWALGQDEATTIRSILSPLQFRLLPPLVVYVLTTKGPIKIRMFAL